MYFGRFKIRKKQFEETYIINKVNRNRIVSLPFVVPEQIRTSKEEPMDIPNKYIFYPAQFWKHKNHLNLLKAITILKDAITDIHLVLLGQKRIITVK